MPLYKRTYQDTWFWWIDLRAPDGSRVRQSTKTQDKKLAQAVHNEVSRALNLARFGLADARKAKNGNKKVRLSEFQPIYLRWARAELAENTVQSATRALATFAEFFATKDPILDDISPRDVENWKTWLLDTPYKRTENGKDLYRKTTTQAIYFRTLSAAFSRAITLECATTNPFKGAEKPKEVYGKVPRFFTDGELLAFFSGIKEPDFLQMMRFCVNAGLRRSELCHVEVTDLKLNDRILWVPKEKEVKYNGRVYYNRTKNAKERDIPMNEELYALCLDMIEARRRDRELAGFPFLFANRKSPKGIVPWDPKILYTKAKRIILNLGLSEMLTLHSLRHTFAANLAKRNVSREIIGELLGHSDPKATEVYTPLFPKSYAWAVDLLDFRAESLAKRKETDPFGAGEIERLRAQSQRDQNVTRVG